MSIKNSDEILDALIELSEMMNKNLSVEDIKLFKEYLDDGLTIEEAQSQVIVNSCC